MVLYYIVSSSADPRRTRRLDPVCQHCCSPRGSIVNRLAENARRPHYLYVHVFTSVPTGTIPRYFNIMDTRRAEGSDIPCMCVCRVYIIYGVHMVGK